MLSNNIGRRAYLEIIHLIYFWHQIGVEVHGAIEGIVAHDQRFRRLPLVNDWYSVLPQGNDTLLRIMPAGLVEYRIELYVGTLVYAGPIDIER